MKNEQKMMKKGVKIEDNIYIIIYYLIHFLILIFSLPSFSASEVRKKRLSNCHNCHKC